MNSSHFLSDRGDPTVVITRVEQWQWHAIEDDKVVGRGEVSPRPDGRLFISIDAWHGTVFDRIADAMLAELPRPLYTVLDEADRELTAHWLRAGFTVRRRERDYLVSTDPGVTGLESALPSGVTIVPMGEAREIPLRELDRAIRDEVEASVGWHTMPAEILVRPDGDTVVYPSRYGVAVRSDRYVGLVRVSPLIRQPRIGLIAVLAAERRHGIARALLAEVLSTLHRNEIERASAEVDESNAAAIALFEGIGARQAGTNLELWVD